MTVPDELIRPAAEVLERQYDQEYDAPHLTWRDFAGEAREILEAVLDRHEQMCLARWLKELPAQNATQRTEIERQVRQPYEDLLSSIALYIGWRYVTKQLTTEQKELFADALERESNRAHGPDGDDPEPDLMGLPSYAPRWWRDDYVEAAHGAAGENVVLHRTIEEALDIDPEFAGCSHCGVDPDNWRAENERITGKLRQTEAVIGRAREALTAAIAAWRPDHEYYRERANRKGYRHDEMAAEISGKAINIMTKVLAALSPAGGSEKGGEQ